MDKDNTAEYPEELLLSNLHRLLELIMLSLGAGCVPFGVGARDART